MSSFVSSTAMPEEGSDSASDDGVEVLDLTASTPVSKARRPAYTQASRPGSSSPVSSPTVLTVDASGETVRNGGRNGTEAATGRVATAEAGAESDSSEEFYLGRGNSKSQTSPKTTTSKPEAFGGAELKRPAGILAAGAPPLSSTRIGGTKISSDGKGDCSVAADVSMIGRGDRKPSAGKGKSRARDNHNPNSVNEFDVDTDSSETAAVEDVVELLSDSDDDGEKHGLRLSVCVCVLFYIIASCSIVSRHGLTSHCICPLYREAHVTWVNIPNCVLGVVEYRSLSNFHVQTSRRGLNMRRAQGSA